MKTCRGCKETKPLTEFYGARNKSGLQARCKRCLLDSQRIYRAKNREKVYAITEAWRLRNMGRVNELSRAAYARNPEAWKERQRKWRKANPEKKRAQQLRLRARRAGAAGWDYTTAELIVQRVLYYGSRCVYCGVDFECIDHRIPLRRGGSHWPSNLVPACIACNSSKLNKTEKEFRGR